MRLLGITTASPSLKLLAAKDDASAKSAIGLSINAEQIVPKSGDESASFDFTSTIQSMLTESSMFNRPHSTRMHNGMPPSTTPHHSDELGTPTTCAPNSMSTSSSSWAFHDSSILAALSSVTIISSIKDVVLTITVPYLSSTQACSGAEVIPSDGMCFDWSFPLPALAVATFTPVTICLSVFMAVCIGKR